MHSVNQAEAASTVAEPERVSGAKVAAARQVIMKPADLRDMGEGKLLALRALNSRMHTFDDDEHPTRLVEIIAVDLSGTEPVALGVVEVSWTYVVRQLQIARPNEWLIGILAVNSDEHGRVQLSPPPDDLNLDRVATMLSRLTLAPPEQLALPIWDEPAEQGGGEPRG